MSYAIRAILSTASRRLVSCSIVFAVAIVALLPVATAQSAAPELELERAGVAPVLVESNDTVCDGLLAYGADLIVNGQGATLEGSYYWNPPAIPGFTVLDSYTAVSPFVTTQGAKVFLEHITIPGCGGGCETYQMAASTEPFMPVGRWQSREEMEAALARTSLTPRAANVRLQRRGDDLYYVTLFNEGSLSLLQLSPQGTWTATCRVLLKPAIPITDPVWQDAAASVERLNLAVDGLMRGSGDCGTLHTHGRWAQDLKVALKQVLWAPRRPRPPDPRDDATYALDMTHMAVWAQMGLDERDAYRAYQTQFDATLADVTRLYEQRFGLAAEDARSRADYVLREAVSSAIRFYNYSPYYGDERRLRQAILDHRPIEEIRTIKLSTVLLDGIDGNYYRHGESLLNVAVEYPEALAYLLELGANPNKGNDFGKTPLMYAAQRNAIVGARLLLDAGANPDAATTWPEDRCYYVLQTATITPLHYAVRYASAELVDLLLDRGAATYIRTTKYGGTRSDAAVDWFRRYTSGTWAEPNHNIAAEDVERLANRVAVPSAEDRAALAGRLTLDAEARYAAGDAPAAYGLLRRALMADEANPRALADMSLIAFRAAQPGEAAGAANKLIDSGVGPRLAAQAWFNLGLACEAADARFAVLYEASQPCVHSKVYPFLQAWLTEPTNDRAEKIADLFTTTANCIRARADGSTESYLLDNGVVDGPPRRGWVSRIYIYHPAAESIEADAVEWTPATYLPNDRLVPSGRHEIGDMAITIFEAKAEGITTVNGMPCVRQR